MNERDATYVFNHINIMVAYHKGNRSAGEADQLLRAQVQVARYIVCIIKCGSMDQHKNTASHLHRTHLTIDHKQLKYIGYRAV